MRGRPRRGLPLHPRDLPFFHSFFSFPHDPSPAHLKFPGSSRPGRLWSPRDARPQSLHNRAASARRAVICPLHRRGVTPPGALILSVAWSPSWSPIIPGPPGGLPDRTRRPVIGSRPFMLLRASAFCFAGGQGRGQAGPAASQKPGGRSHEGELRASLRGEVAFQGLPDSARGEGGPGVW